MNTIMMETKVDATEHYETGEKMINIAHAFGIINVTVFQHVWYWQELTLTYKQTYGT